MATGKAWPTRDRTPRYWAWHTTGMDDCELLHLLRALVGDVGVLTGEEVRSRSCDPLRKVPIEAPILVRPASTEELSSVMALCSSRGQRVVPHGGRTGVSGGAYAGTHEIVISLERMNRIEEICPIAQLAVVQAGVTLEALQTAVAEQDLFYPVDLGAKGTATIGGTIATNAGGNRVLRWGMTRPNLLGLEAVLADGTIVKSMNRLIKNNTGYDLKHLFVGSEGTLGIVTRAVVRLIPAPTSQSVAFVSVASYEKVLQLLARARRLMTLSAFEVMWRDYYELVANCSRGRRPVEPDQPYYVLMEAMGQDRERDEELFQEFLEEAQARDLLADAVKASSVQQAAALWRVREGSEVIVRELGSFVSSDVSIELPRIDAFVQQTREMLRSRYGSVRTVTFGHLGDNNIHIGVSIGPETLHEEGRIEQILFRAVKEFGGAMTAEHGVGQLKRDFLPDHRTGAEMEVMRRIRIALDPRGLLNHDVLFRTDAR